MQTNIWDNFSHLTIVEGQSTQRLSVACNSLHSYVLEAATLTNVVLHFV